MRKLITFAIAVLGLAFAYASRAQTTQLKQTAAGPNCQVIGCINAPLSDGELFTWSDTLKYLGSYPINGKLAFRGLNYDMSGHSSGNLTIDLAALEANGFAVHEDFDVDCFRCGYTWDDGYLQVANEYVGSDPYLYGWNGAKNITSGTGQVGLVTASTVPLNVTLVSSDPTQIQVPPQVVILAGTLDANFTITATAPTQPNSPPYLTLAYITITATFPDGTSAIATVTVEPLSAPPPPNE